MKFQNATSRQRAYIGRTSENGGENMGKLNLTEQQGEQIAALREEGLALRLEVEARRIAWEAAEQREKAVEQAAIMEKVFTYADDFEDEDTGEIAVTGFDEYRAENGQLIDLPEQNDSKKVQGD